MHVQWVCLEHNRHVCYLHTFAKRSMFSSWDCQIRPRKARGYNKASNRGFEQNILWKKERCVRFDPLLLLGLHVTSKPRSALSLSSKVTLASPSSPLNLNFLIHRVRELNSGWHTHYLLIGMPSLQDDTAEPSPPMFPGAWTQPPHLFFYQPQQSLASNCHRPPRHCPEARWLLEPL